MNDGYSIVIFSNQYGISKGIINRDDLHYRLEWLLRQFHKHNIFILGMFAYNNNYFRKPCTKLWDLLCNFYNERKQKPPKLIDSLYVGDAAGRISTNKTSPYGKWKKDHNYTDRAFAHNLGMKFFTPEEFFKDEEINRPFVMGMMDDKKKDEYLLLSTIESKNSELSKYNGSIYKYITQEMEDQHVIIMIGHPASGKSLVTKFIKEESIKTKEFDYSIISRDELGTMKKCEEKARSDIEKGKSLIIDNMNPDHKSRLLWIEIASESNLSVLFVQMNNPVLLSKHIDMIRVQTSNDSKKKPISNIVFNKFNKDYEPLDLDYYYDLHCLTYHVIKYPLIVFDNREYRFCF